MTVLKKTKGEGNNRFDEDLTDGRLRIMFSPIDKVRFNELKKALNLTNKELIVSLLDVAYAEDEKTIALLRDNISNRLKRGVGYSYLVQIKLLYTVLSIFLKRTGYIK